VGPSDALVERLVSLVLRGGVLLAAAVTTIGGALYLAHHGTQPVDYGPFVGVPAGVRSLHAIVEGLHTLDGEAIMAFGILLLVATPITRVALLAVTFVLERDRLYVAVSTFVLAVLLVSVITGCA
jgi:uncharacterized membrane protein